MTLRELEQALTALYGETAVYATRAQYVALRDYAMRWHDSEDEVARVRVDHDTRTVWLDH